MQFPYAGSEEAFAPSTSSSHPQQTTRLSSQNWSYNLNNYHPYTTSMYPSPQVVPVRNGTAQYYHDPRMYAAQRQPRPYQYPPSEGHQVFHPAAPPQRVAGHMRVPTVPSQGRSMAVQVPEGRTVNGAARKQQLFYESGNRDPTNGSGMGEMNINGVRRNGSVNGHAQPEDYRAEKRRMISFSRSIPNQSMAPSRTPPITSATYYTRPIPVIMDVPILPRTRPEKRVKPLDLRCYPPKPLFGSTLIPKQILPTVEVEVELPAEDEEIVSEEEETMEEVTEEEDFDEEADDEGGLTPAEAAMPDDELRKVLIGDLQVIFRERSDDKDEVNKCCELLGIPPAYEVEDKAEEDEEAEVVVERSEGNWTRAVTDEPKVNGSRARARASQRESSPAKLQEPVSIVKAKDHKIAPATSTPKPKKARPSVSKASTAKSKGTTRATGALHSSFRQARSKGGRFASTKKVASTPTKPPAPRSTAEKRRITVAEEKEKNIVIKERDEEVEEERTPPITTLAKDDVVRVTSRDPEMDWRKPVIRITYKNRRNVEAVRDLEDEGGQ